MTFGDALRYGSPPAHGHDVRALAALAAGLSVAGAAAILSAIQFSALLPVVQRGEQAAVLGCRFRRRSAVLPGRGNLRRRRGLPPAATTPGQRPRPRPTCAARSNGSARATRRSHRVASRPSGSEPQTPACDTTPLPSAVIVWLAEKKANGPCGREVHPSVGSQQHRYPRVKRPSREWRKNGAR